MKAIDLFAGWGGFTLGAEMAGVDVVYAANHWPLAVEAHAANHPRTLHECQDLRQADFSRLPAYDLLLAAPACQGHSQASQPKRRKYHDALRATAWAVVDCAEVTEPRAIIVENVPDFARWKLFPRWRQCLEDLGYIVTANVLTASYHDVPQRRARLFITATRKAVDMRFARKSETPIGPSLDWDDPEPEWRLVADASDAVRARVRKGRANHGERFLTQHVTGHPGVGLDEPIRTITTKDQWAVVDGDWYRPLTIRENARAMGFPDTYRWPKRALRRDTIRGLGNAVCPPVARDLVTRVAQAA
jgi:DNA (cytosine-5)-methyltransferase 1